MIELIVELDPVIEGEGYWAMVVRCATDVTKGSRLLEAVPYTVEFSEGNLSSKQIKGAVFAVDLVVDRILSWEREWDTVNSGMTAKIFVNGDASKIRARTFLIG